MSRIGRKAPTVWPRIRPIPTAIAFGVIGTIAGCASFGGNVKGSFVCQAPGGICAPTSKIDDQAIAAMDPDDTGTRSPVTASATSAVHSPRALKVVLPARQDRFGRWREPQVVYIEPDLRVALTDFAVPGTAERLSLSELAAEAPDLGALEGARTIAPASEIRARVEAVFAAAAHPVSPAPPAKPSAVMPSPVLPAAPTRDVAAPSFPAASAEGLH